MKLRNALAVLCVLSISIAASSQTYLGRILGTVTDKSNAIVTKAKVSIVNVGTSATRNLETNDAGEYVAPNLAPGDYKVIVDASGFKKVERTGIRLEVAKDARIDFQLQPGTETESITVTAEAPLIETTNNTLGGTFSNKSINDLPLNGRDFQNLVVLRPGVQRSPGGGFLSISSNGNRPEDNNFIVDGTDNNDPYYGTTVINAEGVQGTPGSILPIDAIQEFNAQENPPAEYGWKPGAIVNLGLKSGTNDFHGTGYYFHRNNMFDARNYFNNKPDPQKKLLLHQYGFSAGGPIIRKKLFIFGAYEGVRSQVGNTEQLLSPATDSLGGDPANSIPDAITELANNGIAVNPLSSTLLGLFPTTSTGVLNVGFPNRNRNDNFVLKSDVVVNEHNNLSGRYFFGDSLQTERDVPVLRPEWMSQSKLRAQVVGFNWTWAPNSHLVNEARFGYNRFWQTILTADHDKEPFANYNINTGITDPVNFGMPEILIDGFTSLGGNHSWPLYTTPNTTWQFVDNVSWVHNRHTLRFGGEFRYGKTQNLRDRYGKTQIRFRGCFALCTTNTVPDPIDSTPLEDFLAGDPGRGRLFLGDSRREVSMKSFGAFVQDEWRVTPRLTVNAGVRYDLNTVIKEAHNLLGNFDPAIGLIQVGVNGVHDPYNGDHNNFAPRVGLIWDPWGSGKTVIRSGFGMTYEIPHLAIFLGQNGVNNASTAGLNVIPTGALGVSPSGGNILASSTNVSGGTLNWSPAGPVFNTTTIDCSASPCDILGVDRHLRTPYVFNWNVNLQRALWRDATIQVGYVGSSGHRQYSVYDINQVDPLSAAENACKHCEQNGRPFNGAFPFLEFINFLSNGYGSNYHGLQTTLTQRTYKGLNFVLGYTWSHSIDSASLNRAAQPQNSFNPGAERGNSDLDIRHRVTLSSTWDLPGKKGFAQMMEGWTINNIVTLQTGLPYTGTDFENDVSLTGEFSDRWNMFGRSADFPWSTAAPGDPGSKFTFLADGTTDPRCLAVANADQLAAFGCYIGRNNSILAPADAGTFGNLGRNTFRADGIGNWDFSIVKRFKITEKMGMQFRAEFFNLLNTPQFADPSILFNNDLGIPGTFGVAASTPDVAAANPVIGTGGPRNIQLGLKFSW